MPAGRPKKVALTLHASLRGVASAALAEVTSITWPCTRYQTDPVAFFRDILGVDPWSRQRDILEGVRDHGRVAVRSGHRVSKSNTVAGLALWNYCAFPESRTILTSTTARQVDGILWREIRKMKMQSGVCADCRRAQYSGQRPCPHSAVITGEIGDLARTGLKSPDFREILGFTAKDAEAIQGIAGKNLLFVCDEASGIPQQIFEGLSGNLAGGGRIVLTGNPTKTDGEFFDAFHNKSGFYHTLTISSEESPNVVANRIVIEGLATREFVESRKEEWGENSALYRVRVKGEHALHESGRIFSLHTIAEAERAWHVAPDDGRLFVGVDTAGESGKGDDIIMAPRRGKKVLRLHRFSGLDADGHLIQVLSLITQYRRDREIKPVVVIDAEGSVGAKVAARFRVFVEQNPDAFELVCVYASNRALREPSVYDRVRDELAANLARWLLDGGAIPEDRKLAAELHVWEWRSNAGNGRIKLWPPKDDVRKAGMLNRSPDRYDAVALSCWEPLRLQEASVSGDAQQRPQEVVHVTLDPYVGADAWQRQE